MAYRGDDMDLRTPQAPAPEFTSSPVDPFTGYTRSRAPSGPRSAPIWVDDTLLDCCNHAYDVASAHRAAEVRLEHLVYALTRVEEAAETLEARGVRTAGLRREAATVIATEIPAASGSGKTNPRRSDAVEEVLRVAASHAYRRQSPAGVADVAYALFDSGLEFQTLLRSLPANVRTIESGLDVETFRERPSNGPAPHTARGLAADLAVTTQPSRIDALEHALRTLTIEIANERKILSGVLQDLQRELMAQREDTSRLGGATHDKMQSVFGDRLHSLEQAFVSVRNNGGDAGGLQDRLGLLERALQGEISVTRAAVEALAEKPALDLTPFMTRLETIEAAAATERERVSEGLRTLAATVERQPGEISAVVSPPLIEHLNAMAVQRDTQHAATTDRLASLEEAFAAFARRAESAEAEAARERAELRTLLESIAGGIGRESERSQEAFATLTENLTQDLSEMHDGLAQVHSDHRALATTLDAEAQDAANAFELLASRIDGLEKAAAKPVEMLDALSGTVERMHKVTVEKYYRRNRFWYWLFGTDDWLAASWPSQSARIAEELRAIRR